MSAFKDAVANDVKAVFLNGLEFADQHTINGQSVLAVIDENLIEERYSQDDPDRIDGVYKSMRRLYVESSDLNDRPVEGAHLKLDGDWYIVSESNDEMGILEITIEANDR